MGFFESPCFFVGDFLTVIKTWKRLFGGNKEGRIRNRERVRSNKVPTKFKIMYARGFLKGVWGRSGENTV